MYPPSARVKHSPRTSGSCGSLAPRIGGPSRCQGAGNAAARAGFCARRPTSERVRTHTAARIISESAVCRWELQGQSAAQSAGNWTADARANRRTVESGTPATGVVSSAHTTRKPKIEITASSISIACAAPRNTSCTPSSCPPARCALRCEISAHRLTDKSQRTAAKARPGPSRASAAMTASSVTQANSRHKLNCTECPPQALTVIPASPLVALWAILSRPVSCGRRGGRINWR